MHDFSLALIGGALIGAAASLLLLTHGTVAGISGLYGGILRRQTPDRTVRIAFVAGLLGAGGVLRFVFPSAFDTAWVPVPSVAVLAGLLVGFGTQLGSGCTSGHGVCGVSRLSVRSLVATATFVATGVATVAIKRYLIGGGP